MPRGDKPTTTALALKDGWVYEDQLPTLPKYQYSRWFDESLVLDGVRMGPAIEILTRAEWDALWAQLDESKHRDLGAYAELVNRAKKEWLENHFSLSLESVSNGRYAVYLEDLLTRGFVLPPEIFATIKSDDYLFDVPQVRAHVAVI